MDAVYENLAVFDSTVGVLKVYLTRPETFHLGADKGNTGFIFLIDEIIMIRFTVSRNLFCSAFLCHVNTSSKITAKYYTTFFRKNQVKNVGFLDLSKNFRKITGEQK
jgi:hypothetical protein